jgi:DNA-binding PadR family transcriptional regulator
MSKSRPSVSTLQPEYALMGFLYFEPLHGYELHRRLEANLREVWRIPQNQAYNLLKRMEKQGLICPAQSAEMESEAHARVLYTLTDAGRSRFEQWLYAPTPCSARALRIELLTRLFFAVNLDENLPSRLLQDQDSAILAALAGLEKRLAAVPADQVFNRMSLDVRIRQLQNLRAWLQSIEPALFA